MTASGWSNRMRQAFLACLLAGTCAMAHAQVTGKALLLVAAPSLQGPYGQTTLLAVQVGDTHLGFILNRASGVKISALFPDKKPSARSAGSGSPEVYFGGPIQSESLFAVLRRDPGGSSLPLFGGLYVTGKAESIKAIIEKTPEDARYFAGFVGWLAGELESEIGRGFWQVAEPDAKLVFRENTSGMWEELSRGLGNTPPPRPGQIRTRSSD